MMNLIPVGILGASFVGLLVLSRSFNGSKCRGTRSPAQFDPKPIGDRLVVGAIATLLSGCATPASGDGFSDNAFGDVSLKTA